MHQRHHNIRMGALLIVVLLITTACSSSHLAASNARHEPMPTTSTSSGGDPNFDGDINTACSRFLASSQQAVDAAVNSNTANNEGLVAALDPPYQSLAFDLQTIFPPPGQAGQFAGLVNTLNQGLHDIHQAEATVNPADPSGWKSIRERITSLGSQVHSQAGALGVSC